MPITNVTKNVVSSLGDLIKISRLERKMSIEELAERAGMWQSTVKMIEDGDLTIPIGSVFEVAIIVGLPLFGGDEKYIKNLSTMLAYMNKLLPEQHIPDRIVNDDF